MSTLPPARLRLLSPIPGGVALGLRLMVAALVACDDAAGGRESAAVDAALADALPADALRDGRREEDFATVPGPASVSPTPVDRAVLQRFPAEFRALAAAGLPSDNGGLIGRNRRWGAMYAPRFQLGAGSALRISLAAERPREASLAFAAIRA